MVSQPRRPQSEGHVELKSLLEFVVSTYNYWNSHSQVLMCEPFMQGFEVLSSLSMWLQLYWINWPRWQNLKLQKRKKHFHPFLVVWGFGSVCRFLSKGTDTSFLVHSNKMRCLEVIRISAKKIKVILFILYVKGEKLLVIFIWRNYRPYHTYLHSHKRFTAQQSEFSRWSWTARRGGKDLTTVCTQRLTTMHDEMYQYSGVTNKEGNRTCPFLL
jgi:hypothetical protein